MKNICRLEDYKTYLEEQELSSSTINKYIKDIESFYNWKAGSELKKNVSMEYKEYLKSKYVTSTINNKIIILNKYFKFIDSQDLIVKPLKTQGRTLKGSLTETDYKRLFRQAEQKGTPRDEAMLNIFYHTGIRVSELKYVTLEAIDRGYIVIKNKGKERHVPITKTLKKAIKGFIKDSGITEGPIIINNEGEPLGRNYIYKRIKWLAGQARIKKDKATVHAIRHLFAKNWLKKNGNNILQLADILGHESLDTTRIYTKLDIDETRATME